MEQLKALEIAVDLYCCLRSGGGGLGGMTDAQIFESLGIDVEEGESLLDMLLKLARVILEGLGI